MMRLTRSTLRKLQEQVHGEEEEEEQQQQVVVEDHINTIATTTGNDVHKRSSTSTSISTTTTTTTRSSSRQEEERQLLQDYKTFESGLSAQPKRQRKASSTNTNTKSKASQMMELDQHEKHLEGAPEGELFMVQILQRKEIFPSLKLQEEIQKFYQVLCTLKQHHANTTSTPIPTTSTRAISWGKEFEAIDSLRRFLLHHLALIQPYLEDALTYLIYPAAYNLRSSIVRNALLCLEDVFYQGQGGLYLKEMIPLLVTRASHEKQFLRDSAQKVLDFAIETITTKKQPKNFCIELMICLFEISKKDQKRAQVVNVAGQSVYKCLQQCQTSQIQQIFNEKTQDFWEAMGIFFNCRLVECKQATKKSLQLVCQHVGEDVFVKSVKETLKGSLQLDVLKSSRPPTTTSRSSSSMAQQKRIISSSSTSTSKNTTKLSMRERMKQHMEAKTKINNRSSSSSLSSSKEVDVVVVSHENVDPNLLS